MKLPSTVAYVAFALEDAARFGLPAFADQFRIALHNLKDTYALSSVSCHVSRLRKHLDEVLPPSPDKMAMLGLVCLPQADYDLLNGRYNKKVEKANKDRRPLSSTTLRVGLRLLNSKVAGERMLGLCLATGRRSVEIAQTARFEPHPGHPKVVWFTGQVKRKHLEDIRYPIPLLVEWKHLAPIWNRHVEAFQRPRANMDLKRVTESFNLSTLVKNLFGEKAKPHHMRHWYAAFCSYLYRPEEASEAAFIGAILGHRAYEESDDEGDEGLIDTQTAKSYDTCYVPKGTQLGINPDPSVGRIINNQHN